MKKFMSKKYLKQSVIAYGIFLLFICLSVIPSLASSLTEQLYELSKENTSEGDIPTWYQGDEWIYTIDPLYYSGPNGSFSGSIENLKQKVVGRTDGMYKIEITGDLSGDLTMSEFSGECNGEITGTCYVRISDLAEGTTELHSEGTITVLYIPIPYELNLITYSSPLLELYDFPLNIGEQWQIVCMNTMSGAFTIQGLYEQSLNGSDFIDEIVQCTQKEQINVPAGTYECYKVARSNAMMWYSTDVGNMVKSFIDQSNENMTLQIAITLQSFVRTTQPITFFLDISPPLILPGTTVVISGQAFRTESGDPIQNGIISIKIPSTGDSWSTNTDSGGFYSKTIIAPTIYDDTPCGRETGSGGIIVECINGGLFGYYVQTLTTIQNTPPAAPSINGETDGDVGVSYSYTVVTTDSEMDEVMYYIDWGDMTNSSYGPPFPSGESVVFSHTFTEEGTYTIKVKATDVYNAESDWGTLQVSMPKSFSFNSLLRFLERFPILFQLLQTLLEH